MVVIMKEGSLVGSEVFPPGTYRLGRAPGEDLQLDDPAVSAHHASFALRNGQIGIRDDGSANGLFVNGKKVSVVRVTSKDEVQVGAYTLKMRVLEKSDGAAAGEEAVDSTVESTIIQQERPAKRPVPATRPPSPAQLDRSGDEDATSLERGDTFPVPAPAPARKGDILNPRPMPNRGGKGAAAAAAVVPTPEARPNVKPGTQPSVRLRAAEPEQELELTEAGDAGSFELPTDVPREVPQKAQPKARVQPQARARPQALERPEPQAKPQMEARAQPKALGRTHPKPESRLKPFPKPPGQVRRAAPPPGPMPEVATSGAPVLRAHLLWGDSIIRAQILKDDAKLRVGPRDSVMFPLYGWPLPKKIFTLAAYKGGAWQVSVPAEVEAFQIVEDGKGGSGVPSWSNAGFEHGSVRPMVVQRDGDGLGHLTIGPGDGVRLANGRISVELRSEMPSLPVPFNFKPKVDASLLGPFAVTFVLAAAFLIFMPKRSEMPDFNPKALPPLKAILAMKQKKETPKTSKLKKEAEKIVQEKKIERVRHETHEVAHKEVSLPVPESHAQQAIMKLMKKTAATQQLFSAVSKIGKGGGANFKASGLIGKVPLSFGGVGGFAIGGAIGKGGSTHGSAFFGLGGIGAPGGMGRGRTGRSGVQGLLPMEAVRKVVDEHISEVQECYENGLIRNPGLSGKLVVEWTIGTNGRVSKVGTKIATLQSNAVSDCIIGHLKGWVFPKPTGGTVVVSYPFIFKSVGG
jgi:pSer/pThr/pTyr-binding forkhead associated (FHA) protein